MIYNRLWLLILNDDIELLLIIIIMTSQGCTTKEPGHSQALCWISGWTKPKAALSLRRYYDGGYQRALFSPAVSYELCARSHERRRFDVIWFYFLAKRTIYILFYIYYMDQIFIHYYVQRSISATLRFFLFNYENKIIMLWE